MNNTKIRRMQTMSQAEIKDVNGNGGLGSRVAECRKCGWVVQDNWLGKGGHNLITGHKGDWKYYDLW